tara:strand:- start:685 stop:1293 length:609 start_codon:yes stop_codon:yes gene_type:complete
MTTTQVIYPYHLLPVVRQSLDKMLLLPTLYKTGLGPFRKYDRVYETMMDYYLPGQYYIYPLEVKNIVVACNGSKLPPREIGSRMPLLLDTNINDLFTLQKQYKKYDCRDIKRIYNSLGKKITMKDGDCDLIYYTNSKLPYSRIVYINQNNKKLINKYMPWRIDAVKTISDWFLECKYNPKYKYCRNKQYQNLLDIYDEDELA